MRTSQYDGAGFVAVSSEVRAALWAQSAGIIHQLRPGPTSRFGPLSLKECSGSGHRVTLTDRPHERDHVAAVSHTVTVGLDDVLLDVLRSWIYPLLSIVRLRLGHFGRPGGNQAGMKQNGKHRNRKRATAGAMHLNQGMTALMGIPALR